MNTQTNETTADLASKIEILTVVPMDPPAPKTKRARKAPLPVNVEKVGAASLALLEGVDHSEFGDVLTDQAWQFSVKDYSKLSDHAFGGALAVCIKKGLVDFSEATERAAPGCSLRDSNGISLTEKGYATLLHSGYTPKKLFSRDTK